MGSTGMEELAAGRRETDPMRAEPSPPPRGGGPRPRTVVMVPRDRARRLAFVSAAVVGVLAVVASVALGWARMMADPPIEVPDLVGQDLAAAHELLLAHGLRPSVAPPVESAEVPAFAVLRVEPEAGTEVQPGEEVRLTLSAGAPDVPVPATAGVGEAEAVQRLRAAGFEIGGRVELPDPAVPAGAVVRTEPQAGVALARGVPVGIVVSTGPQPVVPEVVGMLHADAEAALRAAGLVTGTITQVQDPAVPAGHVARADPPPGVALSKGVPVALTISTGPPAVILPQVVGLTEEAAIQQLQAAGVAVDVVRQPFSTVPATQVVGQVPEAGVQVSGGTTITLVVSTGAPA